MSCTYESSVGLTAYIGTVVSCLFLVGLYNAFWSLGWVVMVHLLLLAVWLVLVLLAGLSRFAPFVTMLLLGMKLHPLLNVMLLVISGGGMLACSLTGGTDTMRPSMVMGIVHHVVDCLLFCNH